MMTFIQRKGEEDQKHEDNQKPEEDQKHDDDQKHGENQKHEDDKNQDIYEVVRIYPKITRKRINSRKTVSKSKQFYCVHCNNRKKICLFMFICCYRAVICNTSALGRHIL